MQHAKKMLLVEPELIERLKESNENTSENTLSRLDSEMQKILQSKMNDRDKWTLYSQALQRYLHIIEEGRRPLKLSILTEPEDEPTKFNNGDVPYKEEKNNDSTTVPELPATGVDVTPPRKETFAPQYTPSYMIKLIPKTYRKKGEVLLDFIIQSKPKIWWKKGGEVVLNNEILVGSNIFDLISDTLRTLKRPKPLGWEKFVLALKDINVPLSCVGNPTSLQYINQSHSSESTVSNKKKQIETSTPISGQSNETPKRKINWERWTPY